MNNLQLILFWEGLPKAIRGNHFRQEVKGGVLLTSSTL